MTHSPAMSSALSEEEDGMGKGFLASSDMVLSSGGDNSIPLLST